jgi:flavodoxin I
MNVLQIYATNSGSTQLATDIVAQALRTRGATVTVKNASEATPDDLKSPDLIILSSPSWDYQGQDGQPHDDMMRFIGLSEGRILENKPFAVFGLGDSSYPHFCGAVDVMEQFVARMKGKLIVPSLRIDGFFFNQEKHTETLKTWVSTIPL